MAKRRRKQGRQPREAQRREHEPGRAVAVPRSLRGVHGVLLALAVAGMLLTAYLTYGKWTDVAPLYCGEESSCDLVQSSRWSVLLGMPIALWGFLTYAVLAGLVLRMRKRVSTWRSAFFVAGIGVAISLYLTAVSVVQIQATCAYCLASLVLIAAIFGILCTQKPAMVPGLEWRKSLPVTALTAAGVAAGLHLHYSGVFDPAAGPEKPELKALAEHLMESGARFYGAYWCVRCTEQKDLFEASAHRLPYVECSPAGRGGPVNVACLTQNIREYPTWIIGDRRLLGVVQPRALARYTGFPWQAREPESQ